MSEPVILDEVVVKAVTAKALLVVYADAEMWIPISQIVTEETDVLFEKGATGALAITQWIATEKNLL
jgi:hypothetical protein